MYKSQNPTNKWDVQTEQVKEDMRQQGKLSIGDRVYVIESKAEYILDFNNQFQPYISSSGSGGGGGDVSSKADKVVGATNGDLAGLDSAGNLTDSGLKASSVAVSIDITYAELVSLVQSGTLKTGAWYRITDYVTKINGTYDLSDIAQQEAYLHYAKSAEHTFDLIVRAVTNNALDEHAVAIQHEGDDYFADSNLLAWDIKYTIENDSSTYAWADETNGKGVIYFMRDEFNNECGYDFKNVQFLAYALATADPDAVDMLEDLNYDASNQPNRYGSAYYVFQALQHYMEAGDYLTPFPPTWNKDFVVGANILGTIQFPEADATYLSTFNAGWYYTFDLCYNDSHFDLSLNSNTFIIGRCYNNYIGKVKDALAIQLDADIQPWGLNANIFEISDLSEGDSELCIQNYLKEGSYFNLFGRSAYNNIISDSIGSILGNACYSNTINSSTGIAVGANCAHNTFEVCADSVLGYDCNDNIFASGCEQNTLSSNCNNNVFEGGCWENYLDVYSTGNYFGHRCQRNHLDGSCLNNRFGNLCYDNQFQDSSYNILGTLSNHNILEGSSNLIGNDSAYNHIGQNSVDHTLGNGVNSITIGTFVKGCLFENHAINLTVVNNAGNDSHGNQIAVGGYTILSGDYDNSTISITEHQSHPVFVGKNSSGTIKIWNPADLVQ